MRRRDDAHVDLDRDVRAQRLDRAVLQDAQQLGLRGQGQLGDLVQEQRAAVGRAEASVALLDGPREGAALVAEQLGLDQRLGERGAVDRHERLRGARAALVEQPRHQLLARAALARDQRRRRRWARSSRCETGASSSAADWPDEPVARGAQHSARRASASSRRIDRVLSIRPMWCSSSSRSKGFDQVVRRALLERGHGLAHVRERRHEDEVRERRVPAHGAQQGQPIDAGQAHVAQDDVERRLAAAARRPSSRRSPPRRCARHPSGRLAATAGGPAHHL